MQIKTITVSFGRTQSLPEYSNVKPQVTIGAEIEEGENVELVKNILLDQARAFVEAAIDDALEGAEQPPKFSTEPRYSLWASRSSVSWGAGPERSQILVLAPEGTKFDEFELVSLTYKKGYRYPAARQHAEREARERGTGLIDCSDGDLSRIPDEYRRVSERPVPRFAEASTPGEEPLSVSERLFGEERDDGEDNSE